MTTDQLSIDQLAADLEKISSGRAYPDLATIFRTSLDALEPYEDLRTHDVADRHRIVEGFGGVPVEYQADTTPYCEEIHDALDDNTHQFVAVKGPARVAKTTPAENYKLKIGMFGPPQNILWYLPNEEVAKRYSAERVDFMFENHPDLRAKLRPKPSWNRKIVDGQLWEYSWAVEVNFRMRAAPFIMVDEVDAVRPSIRNAIITLIKNRQRDYGRLAKAYICSHPDAGPLFGIDRILVDSDHRIRFWRCGDCGFLVSPCPEEAVPENRVVRWNIPELLKLTEDMDRDTVLDFVAARVHLTCPNCQAEIDDTTRLDLDRETGIYIGKGQQIAPDERVIGDLAEREIAGFVLHSFISPLVHLDALAREFVGAELDFIETQDDSNLKEVTCKSIGETYRGSDPASRPRKWKDTKIRLRDTGYEQGTVPRGVDFLTAFVDVQSGSFEAGAIGWSRSRESWLIDRFSIKQRFGLQDINPSDNIADWDVIEKAVLSQIYPLNDGTDRALGIAKLAVDTGGEPGVSNNARIWASNLLSRDNNPIEMWRIALLKGDAHTNGELYGRPRKIEEDAAGRPLDATVFERTTDVTAIKKIISFRMEIEQPGPGRMHLPKDIDDKYVKELVAETLVNGAWLLTGGRRNELWDIWVGCETCRALLAPDDAKIDWVNDPPSFARPFDISTYSGIGDTGDEEMDFFVRLRNLNRKR